LGKENWATGMVKESINLPLFSYVTVPTYKCPTQLMRKQKTFFTTKLYHLYFAKMVNNVYATELPLLPPPLLVDEYIVFCATTTHKTNWI
jgi:hypothetical protein